MKIIITILLTLMTSILTSSVSFAQKKPAAKKAGEFTRAYGLAGCGLGSVLIGKRGGQIFAATTNNTSFNQSFGISAGSLNCVDSPSAEVAGRMDQFILVNRSQVQGDIARGNGETIAAIGSFMGCPSASSKIGSELKANYSNIFVNDARTNEVTDSVISIIMKNPELSQECNQLG